MGADMMVVPEGALTNITAALLVVSRPSSCSMPMLRQGQACQASGGTPPRRSCGSSIRGIGSHHDSVDLIGFDPARDFTIQPWLAEQLNRGLQPGDVILGAGRDAPWARSS